MSKPCMGILGLLGLLGLAAPQVWAQTVFNATLDQAQEVPPSGSPATGTATMTLNAAGDTLTYSIVINGLDLDGLQTADPNDDVVGLHFHNAPVGVNGGVVFGMISPNHDVDDLVVNAAAGTVTGAWEETDNNGNSLLSAQTANLLAGDLYINAHTVAIPTGAIRGQVALVAAATAAQIPALGVAGIGALALLLAGLGMALLRRRQRA